jgi:hypothetical protein
MVALNRPAARDFKIVEAYNFDKKPLVDEECGFIYQQEDLITCEMDGRWPCWTRSRRKCFNYSTALSFR